MGWWDCGILGGDAPLDMLGDISDALSVPNIDEGHDEVGEDYETRMLYPIERWSDDRAKLIAKSLKKNWDKVQKVIDLYSKDKRDDDNNLVIQVVATVIMASGAAFPRGFRPKAIKAGLNDEWAKEGDERRERILEYTKAVTDYKTGNRIVLTSEGLFSKIGKMMEG